VKTATRDDREDLKSVETVDGGDAKRMLMKRSETFFSYSACTSSSRHSDFRRVNSRAT